MDKNSGNAPRLRFPEFIDDWQNKKLDNLVDFSRGGALSKSELNQHGSFKAIHYGELFTIYNEVISEVNSRTNVNTCKISKVDDILMPTSDVTPQGLARASVIHEQGVMLGGDINILSPKRNVSGDFMSYLINHQKTKIMRLVTGTTIRHIYASDLKKARYVIPSLPEQQKIASFLTAVDQRITNQQQKLSLLKDYKKGVMQKLFTQQIRFKDEGGDDYLEWESKNLGELATIKTGNLNVQDAQIDGRYTFFDRSEDIKKYDEYSYDNEAVIYAGEGSEFLPRYFHGKYGLHQRAYAVSNTGDVSIKFLYYFMLMQNNHFLRTAVGSTVKSLRMDCFTKLIIPLPCPDEQQKIAIFLSAVDDKIKAEEAKLTNAKKFKMSLLQKMFV